MYKLRMGIPEMETLWNDLTTRYEHGTLKGPDKQLFDKLKKALNFLRQNPRHRGLGSHEIKPLSQRYGFKVWQSNLENNTPSAGRLFWTYGPGRREISALGIEPHPEDKKRGAYDRIKLSGLPGDFRGHLYRADRP